MSTLVLSEMFGRVLLVDDVSRHARVLREASQSLHMIGESVKEKLARLLTPDQWAGLYAWAEQENIDLTSAERARETLAEAQQQLAKLPLMTIVAAIPLSQAAVVNIAAWLEDIGPPGSLKLAVACNPAVVGGAVVEWQGRRRDYSLALKLNDKYIAAKI